MSDLVTPYGKNLDCTQARRIMFPMNTIEVFLIWGFSESIDPGITDRHILLHIIKTKKQENGQHQNLSKSCDLEY